MRSDVIGKSLLFIGYSFRDPNIQELFSQFKKAKIKIADCYLIQYYPDKNFEKELYDQYGVITINCHEVYPECDDHGEAFNRYIIDLTTHVARYKSQNEMELLFNSPFPSTLPIVSKYDIDIFSNAYQQQPLTDAIKLFEDKFCARFISKDLQISICNIFVELCKHATTEDNATKLENILFSLKNYSGISNLETLSACFALKNLFAKRGIGEMPFHFSKLVEMFNRLENAIATARSIRLLKMWGRKIQPAFYDFLSSFNQNFMTPDEIYKENPQILSYIKDHIESIYQPGSTTHDNPLAKAVRLRGLGMKPLDRTFEKIKNQVMEGFPKQLATLYDI